MWRAFFLAIGIYMCILGAECLAVEKFEMAKKGAAPQPGSPATLFGSAPNPIAPKSDVVPPEWAPWSLLSAGAVIILYSLTINRQG